jgi:hypothetical protein
MGGDRDGICHEIDLFSSTSNRRVGASLGATTRTRTGTGAGDRTRGRGRFGTGAYTGTGVDTCADTAARARARTGRFRCGRARSGEVSGETGSYGDDHLESGSAGYVGGYIG